MSTVAVAFLAYVGLFLPWVAWRSARHFGSVGAAPSRHRIYRSGMVLQATMLVITWLAARAEWIVLFPPPDLGPLDVAAGVAWVLVKYARFRWAVRRPETLARRRTLRHLAPRTRSEWWGYTALVTMASVTEEAAYRGVLFALLTRMTGSAWVGALGSAALFGLAHLTQGRTPALISGVLGLGNQALVWFTGSLWVPIAAHFAYDVWVGAWVGANTAEGDPPGDAPVGPSRGPAPGAAAPVQPEEGEGGPVARDSTG